MAFFKEMQEEMITAGDLPANFPEQEEDGAEDFDIPENADDLLMGEDFPEDMQDEGFPEDIDPEDLDEEGLGEEDENAQIPLEDNDIPKSSTSTEENIPNRILSEDAVSLKKESEKNKTTASSIVDESTVIKGDIECGKSLDVKGTVLGNVSCNGKLTVSGRVKGSISGNDVFINAVRLDGDILCSNCVKIAVGAVITGNIKAGSVVIAGAVKGDIEAKGAVVLDSTAIIKGNITAKSFQSAAGAVIEGFCSLPCTERNLDDIFAGENE